MGPSEFHEVGAAAAVAEYAARIIAAAGGAAEAKRELIPAYATAIGGCTFVDRRRASGAAMRLPHPLAVVRASRTLCAMECALLVTLLASDTFPQHQPSISQSRYSNE
jgi:hypothetical protein